MKIELENILPEDIERRSFELIEQELPPSARSRTRVDHQARDPHDGGF